MHAQRRRAAVGAERERADDAAAHADAMDAAEQSGEQRGQQRELDHDRCACRETSHTSSSTGIPSAAVPVKKFAQPYASTNSPEKPAMNLGSSSITDVNRAYCVAE